MNSSEIEPYAADIVDTLMELVRFENEDNAVLCMKTIMDLERHQTNATATRVQPFLDLIQEMFQMMEQVVNDTFDSPTNHSHHNQPSQSPRPGSPATTVSDSGAEKKDPPLLAKGMQSFKVLAECPIIVVSVFQVHRGSVSANVKKFVPLIKGILLLQAKPQERAHAEAAARGEVFTGVCKEIKNRAAFGEFITAQVKTMSFLAYLLRVYAQQLADFLPTLPGVVVRLLKDCPREKSSARKELLVAIRHIINFNYRKIFLPKIDELLDERTLIGDGLTVYETMRPLAYSMLADLIHHVRDSLNRDQIRRTVEVYTRNLHDNFPGTSFQTMSAKLLLNMAESITKLENKDDARYFLIMILDAIGDKFAAMNHQYKNAVKLSRQYEEQALSGSSESYLADKESQPDWDEIDIFTAAPIKTSNPRDRAADPVADNKFLFKNLVNGLKNMFYQLKTCNPPSLNIDSSITPVNWSEVSFGYNAEEVRVITKLFHEGARVFRYYNTETPPQEIHYNSPVEFLASHYMSQMSREEKELLESFGTVFHCIDTATFHEVFQTEIPHLHELMFEHTALLHLPQFFLASEATSPAFAGMVLQYLMDQIEEVGTAAVIKSSILLRMFKLSFMAVTLFSSQNEQVLHPHVTKIVTKCVQLSVTAEEPLNYFLLLRSLFRSIGGGRFELLYKEILPLLEMLLETFNNLLEGARKKTERDLYVELTLTVPARLSHLLPHLNHLMKPLVVALRAGSDLVGQGLRTLELCVDNLTADYLDPIMAPIMDELMTALWDHLRPNPYSHFHAHTTMRILGKLGGRNRKFLTHPPQLTYRTYSDDEPSFDVRLIGSNKDRAFAMNTGIDFAISKLLEVPVTPAAKASDSYYKQQSFKLLSTQLKLLIGHDHLPDDLATLLRMEANDLVAGKFDASNEVIDKPERDKSVRKRRAQESTLQKLLKACIFATTIPELKPVAKSFVADVCRHFTVIEVGRALVDARRKKKEFDVNAGEGPLHLDTRVLADAFVDGFSSDDVNTRLATEDAMLVVRDTASVVFGSVEKAAKLPFFQHMAKIFCHNCHQAEWYTKAGAAFGIKVLATQLDLGHEWLMSKQTDFTRALMFVVKDMPEDLPASTRSSAEATLENILRQCTTGLTKEMLANEKSKLCAMSGIFVSELSHLSRHVREAAQHALSVMAKVIDAERYELILPVKDRLIAPIFNKPLRACPPQTQIGFIDAITFCLGLGHDIVPFNDQLNRLMLESLSLVDADDESLVPRAGEFNNGELVVNLRVSCLRLLSMAMNFPEFANAPQNTSRARIIAVFFKSLYSKSPEIIEAANAGLKDVLTQTNKLPKDLLQNGLRPILMNLQDPKRLSVAGLDGLARLLTLLTNYFKVEIGARLLEHMKVIADESTLQKVSFGLIEQNPQMKIVAAIFNVFHLLPPAAVTFMEGLIDAVLDLEFKLRRTTFSPFRKPLVKYLNRYPKESWAFFQARLQDEKYGRFFGQTLADAESEPLRRGVIAETESLMKASFEVEDEERRIVASINAVLAIHAICTKSTAEDWFRSHPQLKQSLLSTGEDLHDKLRRDTLASSQRLRVEQAGDQLMDIFTIYLSGAKDDLDFMFEVFAAAALDKIKTPLQLSKFLYSAIIQSVSSDYRRSIITRCIEVYGNKGTSQKVKTFLFHNVVNPIFAMDVKNMSQEHTKKSALMDKSMSDMLHNRLWRPQTGDISEESTQLGVDHSRMEVLQLSALLIKYHKDIVSEARKDIIKFAWSYIRLEDIINKYGAYVLISYFIWSYETPSKVAMQIYVALLRAHQNEGKALVTQALEILAQVLPLRVQPAADPRYPTWARWPRRILAEETGNLQQVMSIFQFLVKQPDLFYESREYFVPLIVPSLHKIAAPPNPSNESKKLALALVSLICRWETKRAQVSAAPNASSQPEASIPMKRDASGQAHLPPPPTKDRQEYAVPLELRNAIIKYLITFITSLQERYPVPAADIKAKVVPKAQQQGVNNDMCKNAVQLLRDLLSPNLWVDVDVDLYSKVTEPLLTGDKADKPDDKHLTCMVNALQVIRVILAAKKEEWIVAHIPVLQKLLEKALRMDNAEIQDCLHAGDDEEMQSRKIGPLLGQVLDALPEEQAVEEDAMEVDSTSSEFVTFLSTIATETLAATNLNSSINILWTLSRFKPAEIDQHIPNVIRALSGKLAKDHINAYSPPQGPIPQGYRPGEPTMDPYEFELGVSLIKKTIDLLAARMSNLGEQRRPFLSLLASLVEKSLNSEVCNKILDMVEVWVFNSTESWPTLKEKTAVLHKMLLFEQRQDQSLLKRFLDLVIKIYEDPRVTRTELTVRLEHAFLIGTRANDVEMRNRFMTIFDRSLSHTTSSRLSYVLTSQNWDTLADSFWLKQASQLVMGSVEMSTVVRMHPEDFRICPTSLVFSSNLISKEETKDTAVVDSDLDELAVNHKRFNREVGEAKVRDILEPLIQLQHVDSDLAYDIWTKLFPLCWASLSREERIDLEKGMVTLLTREYHQRQLSMRPNVIQALLEGTARSRPRFKLPPHVMKFLSRTYDAWYTALVSLEDSAVNPIIDTPSVRESNLDALVEIYAGLQEDDLFYGTWRRRCKFTETNCALSYEQHGIWDKAQEMYESVQVKARTGVVPFSQGEYYLWEDHWMICAQKLQQWDILSEFAKHENFNDLLLEAAWRNHEAWAGENNRDQLDSMIKSVSDAPTPRRTFFQAFMSLLKFHSKQESRQEFNHVCDEAIQLSIRKWHQLPKRITNAHIPILQNFQQLVELHDASVICDSLHQTNASNLDSKSQELKLLLVAWRDRLPNVWDDINAWQDLVTWRQHVFQLINSVYLPMIPQGANNVANNSYAYRGFHETAWTINQFAHVARKHQMLDICIAQLSKIYTLPNIEIQEAFLKLREQAKCHYHNKNELNNGLDVINNTNLNYFGAQQKAEFYTLKGMFLAKLGQQNEANEAFGIALYYDLRLPKAWAEWGQYSDRRFKEDPQDMELASNAVSCYLEAAGLYKNAKSRKLLSRILWLLSLDNEEGKIASAFENFKGETPVWYWTSFIPQLLSSLEHREARLARAILSKIAKMFPQAIFYQLRTTREELLTKKKQNDQRMAAKQQQSPRPGKSSSPDNSSRPGTANGESATNGAPNSPKPKQEPNGDSQTHGQQDPPAREPLRKPWEYADEIMASLKTAVPLLALSMETMTDQIQKNFKCPPDEDAYRLIVALLNDGLAYVGRAPLSYAQDVKLPQSTEANICRFAETILPGHIRKAFEADFVIKKPTMLEYIQKLKRWRDKFEERLDYRQQWTPLESYSQHLSEFRFLKFEDVEVPGQYLEHKDNNASFVKIERFMPTVELIRTVGLCHRRLTIRGRDGRFYPFAVQHPAARHCRREERILQLFRIFNTVLRKRKESRKRNLYFHLPLMVPIAPHIRLVQDDASYISLQGIYEDRCRKTGMNKDDPILFAMEKLRAMSEAKQNRTSDQAVIMKTEIFTTIQERWVPKDIALEYFQNIYPSFEDFWLFRRQFSYQYAAITFTTYIMYMCNRYPNKITIARSTGDIWANELTPNLNPARPLFYNPEHVPFRLTPNIQTLMGPLAMEGIFAPAIMAIARCLTEPEHRLEAQLSIFVRDEMMFWTVANQKNVHVLHENQLREAVQQNTDSIVKRAVSLAQTPESGTLPANQTVIDLISRAVNPVHLAQADALWMAYL
jgi:transformation/transcription domain-associated protein